MNSSGKYTYSSKIEIFGIKLILFKKFYSQEAINVSVTLQLMNKIDHSKHASSNFEHKYDDKDGYGWGKFISYQVKKKLFK